MKIRLSEHVGTHCASIDDGQKVYNLLASEFKKGNSVEFDSVQPFSGTFKAGELIY